MKKILLIVILFCLSLFIGCTNNFKSGVIEDEIVDDFNQSENLYTICFKDRDGTILLKNIVKHNEDIILPDDPSMEPTGKYYYLFIGWDYNGDGSVDEIPLKATYSFIAVAVYEYTLREYEIHFEVDCESYEGDLVQSLYYGSSAEAPKNMVKDGYTFVSWNNSFDYITGDLTVIAIWRIVTFKLTLETGSEMKFEGMYQEKTIEVTKNYTDDLPVPEYVDTYNACFLGYTDGNGEFVTDFQGSFLRQYTFTEDTSFHAAYDFFGLTGIYQLGYFPSELVKDSNLINELSNYVSENSIDDEVFKYNFNRYLRLETVDENFKLTNSYDEYFYVLKPIDFIYVAELTIMRVSPDAEVLGGFISKDVVYYDSYQKAEEALDFFESLLVGFKKSAFIPYTYFDGGHSFMEVDNKILFSDLVDGVFSSTDYAKSLGYRGSDYLISSSNSSSAVISYVDRNLSLNNIDGNKHGYRFGLSMLING